MHACRSTLEDPTPGAVLTDAGVIAARVVRMATEGTVESVDGEVVRVDARTVCVHGDTPGAVGLATAVRAALGRAGVEVTSFR